MIHIDLSVPPHYRADPPHVILEKKFQTWKGAYAWMSNMGFKTDVSLDWFYNNPLNEYVGVELELKEITGKAYTSAVLSIEGNEDQ
jgi:hypothetical protein